MPGSHWTVETYLDEVRARSNVPSNERTLRRLAKLGDKPARTQLITSYLAVTAELGLQLAPEEIDELTAIQEANLVLMQVVAEGEPPALALGPRIAARFGELS